MSIQALILAAGRGSRLGDTSLEIPKPLLQIGPQLLIEHQLRMLADAGIGPVGMVLGYHADEIRQVVGIRAEYILNPRWATTNSLYSFSLCRSWISGSVFVVNCDVLVTPEIFDRLLNAGPDCLAYDSSSGRGREHMAVELTGGVVRAMGKDLPFESISGENVGVLYLGRETAQALLDKADEIRAEGKNNAWLGEAVDAISRDRDIRAVDVAGLPWVEIDFAYDLDRARREVWPRIRNRARSESRWWRWPVGTASTLVIAVLVFIALGGGRGIWANQDPVEHESDAFPLRSLGGGRSDDKAWYEVSSGSEQSLVVEGPGEFRLLSRSVMPDQVFRTRERPYLLTVFLGDKVIYWGKHNAEPSLTRHLDGIRISKASEDVVMLPAGLHSLRIRFESVNGESGLLLYRIETD